MRRWLALVCVAVLLAAALAVPAAAVGVAVPVALARVEAPVQRPGPALQPVEADARESAAVVLILFRGPPSLVRSFAVSGNPDGEGEPWRGRDGWRRS